MPSSNDPYGADLKVDDQQLLHWPGDKICSSEFVRFNRARPEPLRQAES